MRITTRQLKQIIAEEVAAAVDAEADKRWAQLSASYPRAARGVPRARLVESFAEVLDARQDTVLLPHARVLQLGVASDRGGDGLRGRYLAAVSSGRLVLHDAASGARVDPSHVEEVEASVERRVAAALGAMAAT